ncbi:hypothetical protein ACB092_03G098800 [Castanea dentata]
MSFLDIIGEKILDCVLVALGRQLGYLIHYRSNVDNLKTQVEELRGARNRVQCDVDKAKDNVEKIYDDVQTWLIDSDGVMIKADEIFKDNGEANMKCCNGWCPNLKSRYQVSKRSHKKGLEVKEIKDKGKFDRVGYRESTQVGGTAISNRGYEAFESRRRILTDVLEALKNPNITRIGVYGMGGIGKTMLVKEVLKQAEGDKLFNKYLFVVVSNPPELNKIRREIAGKLGLELGEITEPELADRLCERLKQENRVLIILDDIWKELDLEALGIFFGDDQKGCKLLLTSRFQNILRDFMDTQMQFAVGVLSDDEAINLFEKIVGDFAKTGEFKSNMHQIVKECAGLPIAITTVAKALKNKKNIDVWKYALNKLEMSRPIEIVGTEEKVYTSIKLSYEFLPDEEKSLLLLCSLHGEDYNIKIEDLLKYAVGWDHKIKQARYTVHKLVEGLKDSCLLLDGDDSGTVKMHDVIRDVVIYIAAEDKHMFTIRTAIELQNLSKREDAVAISLPYINDDLKLPNQFECSKLELLLLFDQEIEFSIPDSFFEGLKDLKVLKLSRSWYGGVLPSSLSSLKNLQTLCLDGEVQNAIIIGELENLKALSLSLSDTERLPKEIGQLTHLQLLDLGECSELKFIPHKVLSNLKMLEELYLPNHVEWEVEVQSTEKINAMVSELDHLSHLTKLHIHIENAKILPNAMVFERLESYRIAIGSAFFWHETVEASRILKLSTSFQSDNGYKVLFRKCENLILGEMKGVKNILYELDLEDFQGLKHFKVEYNDEIQYIIKSVGVLDSVFHSLESITLLKVNNLERISYMRLLTESFCNLRVVKVRDCCKLEFVFSSSMVGCFSHLQEMNIEDCEIMSAIVAIEREEEIEVNSEDSIMFANLHSLKLKNLFKLKGFLSVVDSLVLFNGKVAFPNLEELKIKGMDSMKMIWSNQLISDCFGKLETMTVSGCPNLTNIVPPNMLRTLRNLKKLKIYDCNSLEEVFEIQGTNNVEESRDIAAAELISLRLRNLEKVKHVWSMDPQGIITFAKLRTIEISGCSCLKSVFPTSVAKALSQLEALKIKDCAMMEEIVAKEEGTETTTLFVFLKLTTLRLYDLPELKSLYPERNISEWPSLETLDIQKCNILKMFGSNESSMQETNGLGHYANLIEQPLFFVEEVAFPNLEELKIKGMDSMKMIWSNQLISDCFGKLETMTISGCPNLTNIVPPNMLRTLRNLKKLNIYDCNSLEEVFEIQGTNNVEESRDIAAAELISLRLRNLEKVKHVWSMDPQGIITFAKLRTIEISGCSCLKSVFPTSVAKALSQLEALKIKDCAMMEEIVAKEEGTETTTLFVFLKLTTLRLYNLPELKSLYPEMNISEWPSLETLDIQKCNILKMFGSNESSMQETNGLGHYANLIERPLFFVEEVAFPNLEELEIEGMDSMKMIWSNQLISDYFGKLETMTVSGCTNLTNIIPPNMLRTLRNLKELKIYDCNSLEEVFEIQGTSNVEESRDIAAAELISLELRNLEKVKNVWSMDPQGIITFAKLGTIEIDGCSCLKSVFPTSVAKALSQLEALEIKDCAMMEEIVAKEEGAETTTLFVFLKLTTLRLYNLPELKSLYPERNISEWPSLKTLDIQKCNILKMFGSNESSMQETNGLGHYANLIEQPLFFVEEVAFPNLEELKIKGMDSMKMIWSNQLISDCFGKLETMTISGCPNLTNIVPPNMLRTLRNLKKLKIYDCNSLEEVFEIQGTNNVEESRDIAAAELISLRLRNLEKVKHVWSMDPQGIITFAKLRTIEISGCSCLKSVFPTSVAKALSQLEALEIKDCAMMEEIVAKEEGTETTTLFVFLKLTTLRLYNLPELKSLYPERNISEWPSLETLDIQKCNILKMFGSNESSMQETNGLGHYANLIERPLFSVEEVAFPNLEELEIEGMDSMKMIWSNQLISDYFGKLETMTVSGCTNLTNIIPPNMLRTLRNLKELKIYDCNSLEEVFEIQGTNNVEESRDIAAAELISLELRNLEKVKNVWSMDPQGIITFAKLGTIEIDGCSSLKSVFPTSVAKALSQLEALKIRDCAMMEEIVAKEEGIETTTLFVFLKLTTLRLYNLPELKSLYPERNISEWPSLETLDIQKCNKLKMFVEEDKFPKLEYLSLDEGDVMNETCGGPSAEFCCNLKYLTLTGNGEIPNVEAPIARAGVSDFRRLKNIVSFSSTSFHYLKELEVDGSDVLISLLTPSTARTLVQLEGIEINGCKRMTEIVANEGSEAKAGDEIAFNNLKYLYLHHLPSLTAFHLGNRTIKFPSLVSVNVDNCPKLKIFCSGVLSTPKLRMGRIEEMWIFKDEGDGDVDLNATIKEYWEAKLETCDQKFAEKTDASDGEKNEHETNDDLERETTSEVGAHNVMENDD